MLVDDGLTGGKVNEGVARRVLQIVKGSDVLGPGAELGEYAGHTEIKNAITNRLHMLVYVAVKYATQPVSGWKQGPV